MEIVYLYIEGYGPFKEQEFNFCSNYQFSKQKNNKEIILEYKTCIESSIPKNFYSKKNNIQISAIVGNNGAGKTLLAKIIINILTSNFKREMQYVLIIKNGDDFFMQKNNLHVTINKSVSNNKIQIREIGFGSTDFDLVGKIETLLLYHSNFYNTIYPEFPIPGSSNFFNFEDISTTCLLNDSVERYCNSFHVAGAGKFQTTFFQDNETLNALKLISKFNSKNSLFKSINSDEIDLLKTTLPVGMYLDFYVSGWEIISSKNKQMAKKGNKRNIYVSQKWNAEDSLISFLEDEYVKLDVKKIKSNAEKYSFFLKKLIFSCVGNWVRDYVTATFEFEWKHPVLIFLFFKRLWNKLSDYEESEENSIVLSEYFNSFVEKWIHLKGENNNEINIFSFTHNGNKCNFCPKLEDYWMFFKQFEQFEFRFFRNKFLPYIEIKDESLNSISEIFNQHSIISNIMPILKPDFYPSPSSGEMATLSLFSRLYEYVYNNNNNNSYENYIIFFDEIETTMHPELVRNIARHVINFFDVLCNKNIHIFFMTHSPLLLSDIFKGNVCFLKKEKGEVQNVSSECNINSFGCNIFDLYKDAFFLENGTVGCFAQGKIDELLKKVNEKKDFSDDDLMTTMQIGDPVIRNYILNRIKTPPDSVKNKLIAYYENKIKELNGGI